MLPGYLRLLALRNALPWLNPHAMPASSRPETAPSYRKRRRRVRKHLVVAVAGVGLAGVALLVLIGLSFSM